MDSHELNLQLNQSVVQDLSNLEMLRYSYFEAYEYDGNKVDGGDVVTGTPTTKRKGQKKRTRSSSVISTIVAATTSSTAQEEEKEDKDEERKNGKVDGESLHNKDSNDINNMRSLLSSDQFWNTCYQDLKFESMAEANDIYDKLPPINMAMSFYIEFIDYLLINLHILKPSLEEIRNSIEYNQLAKQYYLYFNNHNFHHLHSMQQTFGGKEVNDKLIETIIINFDGVKKMHQLDSHLVAIWIRFLHFVAKIMSILPDSTKAPPKSSNLEYTQQPNPPFAKKSSQQPQQPQQPQQQQQLRQALVDSRTSSLMSQMSKRDGSVWTMDTIASSIGEIESINTGGSSTTKLPPLSEIDVNAPSSKLKVTSSCSDVMDKTKKKKKSFFSKFRGK